MSRRRWMIGVALAAALVGGTLVDEAGARRRGSTFSARIKGRKFKSTGATVGAYTLVGTFGIVSVGGSTKPRPRIGASIRAAAGVCQTPDLATASLPLTVLSCGGDYREYRLGHPEATKEWQTNTGVQMTITGFDGTRVRGTMSGTFDLPPAGEAPITLENGKFNVRLIPIS